MGIAVNNRECLILAAASWHPKINRFGVFQGRSIGH
jgi:hypothetical protein